MESTPPPNGQEKQKEKDWLKLHLFLAGAEHACAREEKKRQERKRDLLAYLWMAVILAVILGCAVDFEMTLGLVILAVMLGVAVSCFRGTI